MNQDLDIFLAAKIKSGKTLTLVTGVFDLLHEEHRNFLLKAKQLNELLLIGIESDQRVQAIKGVDRPINSQEQRVKNLWKWGIADHIFILPANFSKPEEHRLLTSQIRPNALAVSSHTAFAKEKAKILAEFGAQLAVVYDFNPTFSSSKMIANLKMKGCL
jgi:D-beta-D-heptose 7-phosphate kinase/D-beta-D-heptose 1-phosphate adenosyltransferase